MPSVFIYEFLTAGGCWSLGTEPPSGSLLAEGAAMRDAIAADFAACEFVDEVHLLHDVRLPLPQVPKQRLHPVASANDERRLLDETSAAANFSVVIAPEFQDCLEARARFLESTGAKLLSPDSGFIHLTANKQGTTEYLASRDIRVPRGISFGSELPGSLLPELFPAVLKPIDGAGSTNLKLIGDPSELKACDLSLDTAWRLERFQPGIAASVSYLAGPAGNLLLAPCVQHLSEDGRFQYLGGSTPLPPPLAKRALALANRVATALPQTTGYVGIDIVLGGADNGADDTVIEINPRLTTSYLGLRRACRQNLAAVLWRWSQGEPAVVTFHPETVLFSPATA